MAEAHPTFLVGTADFISDRIRLASRNDSQPAPARRRIQLFRDRSFLYQQRMFDDLDDDSCILELDTHEPVQELVDAVLARCARTALSSVPDRNP